MFDQTSNRYFTWYWVETISRDHRVLFMVKLNPNDYYMNLTKNVTRKHLTTAVLWMNCHLETFQPSCIAVCKHKEEWMRERYGKRVNAPFTLGDKWQEMTTYAQIIVERTANHTYFGRYNIFNVSFFLHAVSYIVLIQKWVYVWIIRLSINECLLSYL